MSEGPPGAAARLPLGRAIRPLAARRAGIHNRRVRTDPLYDDGRISCDDEGITVRWYYPWGAKHIAYRAIRSSRSFPLSAVRGKWRIWGSGDFVHWYNLDGNRPAKESGIELDIGGRIRPCITPDDPAAVARIIEQRTAA